MDKKVLAEVIEVAINVYEGIENRNTFKEVTDNSELFKPLKIHQRLSEGRENIPLVNWQEYHPTTADDLDDSYIKMIAAPDYSAEDENYKK